MGGFRLFLVCFFWVFVCLFVFFQWNIVLYHKVVNCPLSQAINATKYLLGKVRAWGKQSAKKSFKGKLWCHDTEFKMGDCVPLYSHTDFTLFFFYPHLILSLSLSLSLSHTHTLSLFFSPFVFLSHSLKCVFLRSFNPSLSLSLSLSVSPSLPQTHFH